MPLNRLSCLITVEKPSSDTKQSSFGLFAVVGFLVFNGFLRWVSVTQAFFSRVQSLLHILSHLVFGCSDNENSNLLSTKRLVVEEKKDDVEICRGDVKMVMTSLELLYDQGSGELQEKFSPNDFSRLFEEKEPSLEEVKEAFDVFDENRDGFIDAKELQRVLCILGLKKEGSSLERCAKMIQCFDENKDGRIDFHEFVRFMEKRLC